MAKAAKYFCLVAFVCVSVSACADKIPSGNEVEETNEPITEFFQNGFECSVSPFTEGDAKIIPVTGGKPDLAYRILLALDTSGSAESFYTDRNLLAKGVIETIYAFVMATGTTVDLSIVTYSNDVREMASVEQVHWTREIAEQRIEIQGPGLDEVFRDIDSLTYKPGIYTDFTDIVEYAFDRAPIFEPLPESATRNMVFIVGDLSFNNFHPATEENQMHIQETRETWADKGERKDEFEFFLFALGPLAKFAKTEWVDYFFIEDTTTAKPRGQVFVVSQATSSIEARSTLAEDWPILSIGEETVVIPPNLANLDIVFFFPNPIKIPLRVLDEGRTIASIADERGIELDLLRSLNPEFEIDQELPLETTILLPPFVIKTQNPGSVARFEFGNNYYQVWNITSPDLLDAFVISEIQNQGITYELVGYPAVYDIRIQSWLVPQGGNTVVQALLQGVNDTDKITFGINGTELGELIPYRNADHVWFSGQVIITEGKFPSGNLDIDLSARRGDSLLFTAKCPITVFPRARINEYGIPDLGAALPGKAFDYSVEIYRPKTGQANDILLQISSQGENGLRTVTLEGEGDYQQGKVGLDCPVGIPEVLIQTRLQQTFFASRSDYQGQKELQGFGTVSETISDEVNCSCSNNTDFSPLFSVAPWIGGAILIGTFFGIPEQSKVFRRIIVSALIFLEVTGVAFVVTTNSTWHPVWSILISLGALFFPSIGIALRVVNASGDNRVIGLVWIAVLLGANYFTWNYAINNCALV